MKMGCQYSRVARLSSRKLKKVRKESTLETNKKKFQPEIQNWKSCWEEAKLSSDLASSSPRLKAVWELWMGGMRVRGEVY